MKIFNRFLKSIIVTTIWAAIYFGIIMPIVGAILNFNFLSFYAWIEKWVAFKEYRWQIDNVHDTILVLTMILWIPIFLFTTIKLVKKRYRIKFRLKPKTVIKRTLQVKNDKPKYAQPRALPSTVQAKKYVAPQLPGQELAKTTEAGGNKAHTNVLQMIKSMATIARKFKVEIFQHILLEGYKVPMAVSTDARAVLIEIVNQKNANWSVEFSDDVNESNWYSEGGVLDKLTVDLLGASNALARAEPNSEVLSAIVLTEGKILNAKQTEKYFKDKGILLLQYNNGEPKSDLLDFASFISAHFDLKEGEQDPAIVKLDKVPLGAALTAVEKTKNTSSAPTENTTNSHNETNEATPDEKEDEYLDEEEDFTDENELEEDAEFEEDAELDEDEEFDEEDAEFDEDEDENFDEEDGEFDEDEDFDETESEEESEEEELKRLEEELLEKPKK